MTQQITIEGSILPSDQLARGERRTVALTPHVQRLIDRGFVVVVDENAGDAPEPDFTDENGELTEPHGGSSKVEWQKWLDAHEVAYSINDSRDDLVAIWQGSQQG